MSNPSASVERSFLLTAYLGLLLCVFGIRLDVFLGNRGWLPINPYLLFLATTALILPALLLNPQSIVFVGRWLLALHTNNIVLIFLAIWLALHVLYLPGVVLPDNETSPLVYFPIYQIYIVLFGMMLGTHCNIEKALHRASIVAMLILIASILVDVFYPATFSDFPDRPAGFAMNPNISGFTLLLLLAVSVRYRSFHPSDVLLTLAVLVGVILTLSRAGMLLWVSFATFYAIHGLAVGRQGGRVLRLAAFVASITLAFVVLAAWLRHTAIFNMPSVAERFAQISLENTGLGSDLSRLELADFFIDLVARQPLLGHGVAYSLGGAADAPYGKGPHNMYLRFWVDLGLPGLIAYSGILLAALVRFCRVRFAPGISIVLLTLLAGFFSHTIDESKAFLLLFGICLALSALPAWTGVRRADSVAVPAARRGEWA